MTKFQQLSRSKQPWIQAFDFSTSSEGSRGLEFVSQSACQLILSHSRMLHYFGVSAHEHDVFGVCHGQRPDQQPLGLSRDLGIDDYHFYGRRRGGQRCIG